MKPPLQAWVAPLTVQTCCQVYLFVWCQWLSATCCRLVPPHCTGGLHLSEVPAAGKAFLCMSFLCIGSAGASYGLWHPLRLHPAPDAMSYYTLTVYQTAELSIVQRSWDRYSLENQCVTVQGGRCRASSTVPAGPNTAFHTRPLLQLLLPAHVHTSKGSCA